AAASRAWNPLPFWRLSSSSGGSLELRRGPDGFADDSMVFVEHDLEVPLVSPDPGEAEERRNGQDAGKEGDVPARLPAAAGSRDVGPAFETFVLPKSGARRTTRNSAIGRGEP